MAVDLQKKYLTIAVDIDQDALKALNTYHGIETIHAVYLMEDFLKNTTDPYYDGEVDYGARDEHCWNGDHDNPNAISRLRYNTMYMNKILKRIDESAPKGADLTSWRY